MKFSGFDVETAGTDPAYGLQPSRVLTKDAWLTSAAFAWRDPKKPEPVVIGNLYPVVGSLKLYLNWCSKNNFTIVGWNTAFDCSWLIALGLTEEVMRCKWMDVMLLWRHIRCAPTFEYTKDTPGFGLKEAVKHFFPDRAGYEKAVKFDAHTDEELQLLKSYNMKDSLYTMELAEILWPQLTPSQQRVALVEAACIPLVAATLVDGVCADMSRAVTLSQELDDTAKVSFVQLKMADPEVSPELLASPKQLSNHIQTKWGLRFPKYTATGQGSTDRESLAELAVSDPRAALVNTYREASNNKTKFTDGTIESLNYNGDGRVRPAHRIFGTYTGRMTISSTQGRGKAEVQTGVALHQWKRDPKFRGLIKPPPGYTLCEFDFAGQEFRWMAVVSGDPTMLSLCAPGEDAHSYMAAQIAAIDYHTFMAELKNGTAGYKPKRQLGKVANLSLQYRTSARKLVQVAAVQHNIKLTDDEGVLIHRTYQQTYRKVPEYWKQQKYLVKRNNYIENLAGRRVWLRDLHIRDPQSSWGYDSTAVNYPIQSMGADQKYLALMVLRTLLPKWGAQFYYELHDGLFVIVPDEHVAEAVPVIQYALSNLPYERAFRIELPIQFPTDAKTGKSWGELVPWPS